MQEPELTGGREDERLHGALAEFRQIHATLKNGNAQPGVSSPVVEMITDGVVLGPQAHRAIEDFIARTGDLMSSRRPENVDSFVKFVAGPLLDRLNLITNHISHTLDQLHERQRQQAAASETAVHEALAAIEKVSVTVRIIAINAATEAVRAGDFGRGFAIIAKEIRALSDRAGELVQSVRTNLPERPARLEVVPLARLERARLATNDFESFASTIPPQGHGMSRRRLAAGQAGFKRGGE